jgi:hypothetical protein
MLASSPCERHGAAGRRPPLAGTVAVMRTPRPSPRSIVVPDSARFLWEFVRDPRHTAAPAPSSPSLAAAMTSDVPADGDPTIVELGAGTGALTTAI